MQRHGVSQQQANCRAFSSFHNLLFGLRDNGASENAIMAKSKPNGKQARNGSRNLGSQNGSRRPFREAFSQGTTYTLFQSSHRSFSRPDQAPSFWARAAEGLCRNLRLGMPTVAEQLRQAREKSGRSISDVSEITKIKTDHIRALEEGNYDVFSAPVYVRGFARTYANLLKLDAQQLLAQLDEELGSSGRFKEHPRFQQQSKGLLDFCMLQLSKVNWSVALPLVALAFILLGSVLGYRWWKEQQSVDPLKGLGPGLYQGPTQKQSGEKLRVPSPVH
jgi:hypothetical protein